ncbi:MAG: 30S ribosomal protein S2, partial [bacterium]|nr:30S ribosomal protein S2 [bacterium]
RIPECLVIVDPTKERNAIREARKLGVTTVALIDTDSDPESVDLPIPGNDDGIRSIELILEQLANAIIAGKAENPDLQKKAQEEGAEGSSAAGQAESASGEAADTQAAQA